MNYLKICSKYFKLTTNSKCLFSVMQCVISRKVGNDMSFSKTYNSYTIMQCRFSVNAYFLQKPPTQSSDYVM